jgi:transcriptional regulator with XRE-family HTH domain
VVREAAGKTQADVAAESQMDQADVSRLESREEFGDCQVSTLERYVTALGGNVELVAAFGNKRIVLCGAESGDPKAPANNRMQRTRPARATKARR